MSKKIGVILSGCGVSDGAEIHESVLTLLAIDRAGCEAVCFAPDIPQMHVIDHLTGEPTDETRNVLVESARIARGKVTDITNAKAADLDAVIFPGGSGAAKNLCDFGVKGTECTVHPEVIRLVSEFIAAGKPIGAVCIAPALIAAALRGKDKKVALTIGTDAETAAKLETMGSAHVSCPVTEFNVDKENKIVSTPAYMLATRISEVAEGVDKLVAAVIDMA